MSTISDSDSRKTRVFLSYSRKNSAFAQKLRDCLIADGFDAFLDIQDIVKGEPWRERLQSLIFRSDSVLFIVSPDSVASEICDWEINEAERLAKRVLPVVCQPTPDDDIPGRLKRLNYSLLDTQERWADEYPKLCDALRSNVQWVREHTRLSELAARWDHDGRPESQLLRLDIVHQARRWETSRPPGANLSELLITFLNASEEREVLDRERLLAITGRAYLRASRQARANGQHDAALRAAAAGILVSEDIRAQFVPERRDELLATVLNSRLMCVLGGEAADIRHASFSENNANVLTVSSDGRVRVWDSRTGELAVVFANPDSEISFARFNHSGTSIVTTSTDHSVHLWDSTTGLVLTRLSSESFAYSEPEFTPDDRHVLVLQEGAVCLVDASSGVVATTFGGHRGAILSAKLSPSGNRVFTIGQGTIRVWDANTGLSLRVIRRGYEGVLMAASADGHRFFTFLDKLKVWNYETGRRIASRTWESKEGNIYKSLEVSRDGRLALISVVDGAALVIDVSDGGPPIRLAGHSGAVRCAAFNSDASRAVTAGDETCRIWDTRTGRELVVLRHDSPVSGCSFSPDGLRILTTSQDGTVRIWDARSSLKIANLDGYNLAGENIALCLNDRAAIRIWLLDQPEKQFELPCPGSFSATDIHESTRRVAIATRDGAIRIWDAMGGGLVATLNGHNGIVSKLRFSHDGTCLVSFSAKTAPIVWNIDSGEQQATLGQRKHTHSEVTFTPREGEVVLSSEAGAQLWDMPTGTMLSFPGVDAELVQIVVSPNGRSIATRQHGGEIRIWSADRASFVALPSTESTTNEIRFTADSEKLITSGRTGGPTRVWYMGAQDDADPRLSVETQWGNLTESYDGRFGITRTDKIAKIIDLSNGNEVRRLLGNEDFGSAQFSRDGTRIVTTSGDYTVRVWRAVDGLLLLSIPQESATDNAHFCGSDKRIIVGSLDGKASLLDIEISAQLATAEPDHWLAASLSCGRGHLTLTEQSDPLFQSVGNDNTDLYKLLATELDRQDPQSKLAVEAAVDRLNQPIHPNCYLSPTKLPGAVVAVRRSRYRAAIFGGSVGVFGGMLLLGILIWLWTLLRDALH